MKKAPSASFALGARFYLAACRQAAKQLDDSSWRC